MMKDWDKKMLHIEFPTGKDRHFFNPEEELKVKKYTYRITKDLALQAADLLEDHNPWYYGNSPFGEPICNPGIFVNDYLEVIVENGYNGVKGVHYRNNMELLYPPRQGHLVTVTVRPLKKYEKRGRIWLEYYMEIVDDEGHIIMRGETTEVMAKTGE